MKTIVADLLKERGSLHLGEYESGYDLACHAPTVRLYNALFSDIPSGMQVDRNVTATFFKKLFDLLGEPHTYVQSSNTKLKDNNYHAEDSDKVFVFLQYDIIIKVTESIYIYYNHNTSDLDLINKIISLAKVHSKRHKVPKYIPHFNIIGYNVDFYKRKQSLPNIELLSEEEIGIYYGLTFKKKYPLLLELLDKPTKGLVIFHGAPGTGKTSAIKQLIVKISENRDLIYFPPECTDLLGSPSFIPFILSNKECIILAEDAENVLQVGSEQSRKPTTTNLLNLTDGIMADVLQTLFICTFNCHKSEIDPSLVRPGRLKFEWEFKALSAEESNIFLEYKQSSKRVTSEHTLAELFQVIELETRENQAE